MINKDDIEIVKNQRTILWEWVLFHEGHRNIAPVNRISPDGRQFIRALNEFLKLKNGENHV